MCAAMTSVKKMTIGIGHRDGPQPGGTGLIYIDDIWITKRMPEISAGF